MSLSLPTSPLPHLPALTHRALARGRCAHARAEEQHPTRGPSATVEGSKRKTEQNSHEVDSQAILLQGRGPSEGGLPGCPRGVPCRRAVDSLAGQTESGDTRIVELWRTVMDSFLSG